MRIIRAAILTLVTALPAFASADIFHTPRYQDMEAGIKKVIARDYLGAEPLLRRALAADPSMAEARYNLGVVLRETGRAPEAVAEYREALSWYRPDDVANRTKALYGIALASDDMDDPAAAARAWQAYVDVARRYPDEADTVALAEQRMAANMDLAAAPGRTLGTRKASR